MGPRMLDVQTATDHRAQRRVITHLPGHVELRVAQVADARCKPKAQQMHQCEHMIGEARSISVVLLDAQIRFVVQQVVQYISRVAHTNVDYPRAERGVLIGDMGVKQLPRFCALSWVDVTGTLGPATSAEALAIRQRSSAVAPVLGERMLVLGIDEIGQARRIGFVPDVPGLQPGQLRVGRARA